MSEISARATTASNRGRRHGGGVVRGTRTVVNGVAPGSMADKPDDDENGGDGVETVIVAKPKSKTQRPSLYKVLLLNDDYTPMEFVVHVLERIFGITNAQAVEIMLTVHRRGVAVVGVFSYEIAETKVTQVMDYARRNQHPLQCTMEKE